MKWTLAPMALRRSSWISAARSKRSLARLRRGTYRCQAWRLRACRAAVPIPPCRPARGCRSRRTRANLGEPLDLAKLVDADSRLNVAEVVLEPSGDHLRTQLPRSVSSSPCSDRIRIFFARASRCAVTIPPSPVVRFSVAQKLNTTASLASLPADGRANRAALVAGAHRVGGIFDHTKCRAGAPAARCRSSRMAARRSARE